MLNMNERLADNAHSAADREFVHSRLIDAPRERVFRAFSDPAHLARWWGPNGFRSTFQEFDFRPGGAWRFVMHGPDGTNYPNECVFVKLSEPELIVFEHISDHHFQMTITFAAQGRKTLVGWRQVFDSAAERERVARFVTEANEQNLDRLAAEALGMTDTGVHPRLLFGPEDIPVFREKAKRGIPGRALAEILRRCERATQPGNPDYIDVRPGSDLLSNWSNGAGNRTTDGLHCLAFAYLLTGDCRWADYGIALMRLCCVPSMQHAGIAQATLEGELPLAFDILHPVMTPEDRRQVEVFLRECVVVPYQRSILAHPTRYFWGLGTNIFLHNFNKYVLALGAAYRPDADAAALAQCASLLRRTFHLGVDQGGAIGEGSSYGWGDAEWATLAAEVLRRAGVADLWEEEPNYREMIRQWAYLVLPGRRGQNTIGDAWRFAGTRPPLAHLFHRYRTSDPCLQWTWDRMGGRGAIPAIGTAPECFSPHVGLAAIWEDDAAASADPGRQGWPLAKTSGQYGVTVMRSGWGDDDLYFSLLAAGRSSGCHIHQHVDAGHFSLFALNEAFSIDSGYGDGRGCYHSVYMPDGKEPPSSPVDFDNCRRGGYTEAFAAAQRSAYVRVNIGEQWDCLWNYRHALQINAPGASPYMILLDNVNYANGYGHGIWLINSEPGNRVELDEPGGRADIRGRQHRLECLWAWPCNTEYPSPHRLELATDVIDSFPLGHRTSDVDYFHGLPGKARPEGGGRWGAGLRPRVKATLWGYNGVLVSALVPRRRDEAPVEIDRFGDPVQFGMTLRLGSVTDTIVASPFDRHINTRGIEGEAALAVIRRSSEGRLLWWAAADAYALSVDGAPVMPRQGVVVALREAAAV